MNNFSLYFKLGWQHIADLNGIDHILFILALCVRYQFADWKKILILITAFTIGHSVTLGLSVFSIIDFSTKWIEFLIPVTILITACSNVFVKKFVFKTKFPLVYFFALGFGLIHGLGFSNYIKSILGIKTNIIAPLFAFNVGLEVGQLLIVFCILLLTAICIGIFKLNRREYILFLTGGIFAVSLQMIMERWPL
jgi:HupE / UreJ protein